MGAAFRSDRRLLLEVAGAAAVAFLGTRSLSWGAEDWQRPGGPVPEGEWWAGGGQRMAPSTVEIVSPSEPGERLMLSGRIVDRDGRPARAITVYVYQTDVLGLYYREGRQDAGSRLRGWARTDDQGRYEFATIRPGHYPGRTIPAHIHMTVSSDSMREWWVPEVRFEGDPFITAVEHARSTRDGAYGNVRRLERDKAGVLRCTRDLRL